MLISHCVKFWSPENTNGFYFLLHQNLMPVPLFLFFFLFFFSLCQGLFQASTQGVVFQHDALHIQHGDHDEGEGQHALLLPSTARHGAVHGEESHWPRSTAR